MKLHSPAFEQELRRGVKQAVRADPVLRKEHRRVRKFPRQNFRARWPFRLACTIAVGGVTIAMLSPGIHLDTGLLALNGWLLLTALVLVQSWLGLPFRSRDIAALRLLPVADENIFRFRRDQVVAGSLYTILDLLAGLGVIGLWEHFGLARYLALIPIALLGWTFVLALPALGAARLPTFPYGRIALGLFLFALGTFISQHFFGRMVMRFLDHAAPYLNTLVPTAWPVDLVHLLTPNPPWLVLAVLPLVAIVIGTWRSSMEIIASRFEYREHTIPSAPDLVPGEDEEAAMIAQRPDALPPRFVGLTAIEEGILTGPFLAREEWTGGPIETLAWRWFAPREKTLAEFAFPNGVKLTAGWLTLARNFVVVLLVGVPCFVWNPLLGVTVFSLGFIVVYGHAINLLWGTGATFRLIHNGGVSIPLYAIYPVDFRGMTRMYLKTFAVQWPLFVVLLTASAIPISLLTGHGFAHGLLFGLQGSIVFIGARLFILVMTFSAQRNDVSGLRTVALLLIVALLSMTFVGLAMGVLLMPAATAWLCTALALLTGVLVYFIYGWFHRATRFDLMRAPR